MSTANKRTFRGSLLLKSQLLNLGKNLLLSPAAIKAFVLYGVLAVVYELVSWVNGSSFSAFATMALLMYPIPLFYLLTSLKQTRISLSLNLLIASILTMQGIVLLMLWLFEFGLPVKTLTDGCRITLPFFWAAMLFSPTARNCVATGSDTRRKFAPASIADLIYLMSVAALQIAILLVLMG